MWLWLQIVYALVAWSIAIRAVLRTAKLSGLLDVSLLKLVRGLARQKKDTEIAALCDDLNSSAVSEVLREPVTLGEDMGARVNQAIALSAPPSTAMRGMATIGTSLGFLGAIATMRTGVDVGGAQRAMARAIECALLGFVTAIPLWTAITVSSRHMKTVRTALDKLADAREGTDPGETIEQNTPKDSPVSGVDDSE